MRKPPVSPKDSFRFRYQDDTKEGGETGDAFESAVWLSEDWCRQESAQDWCEEGEDRCVGEAEVWSSGVVSFGTIHGSAMLTSQGEVDAEQSEEPATSYISTRS